MKVIEDGESGCKSFCGKTVEKINNTISSIVEKVLVTCIFSNCRTCKDEQDIKLVYRETLTKKPLKEISFSTGGTKFNYSIVENVTMFYCMRWRACVIGPKVFVLLARLTLHRNADYMIKW